jgi:hypothetical protein
MFLQLFAVQITKLGLGLEIVLVLLLVIERTIADMNNTCLVSSNKLGDVSTLTAIDIPVLLQPVKAV